MAKPPSDASLLFGALAESGLIKQRRNGSFEMLLDGVKKIDWFTDRPYRVEGTWKPQKLLRKWDKYFATSEPNAQASFKVGGKRELLTFEMLKPEYNAKKKYFNFKLDTEIINDRETKLLNQSKNQSLDDVTLFIDDANPEVNIDETTQYNEDLTGIMLSGKDLTNIDLSGINFKQAQLANNNFTNANLNNSDFTKASIYGSNFTGANLTGAIFNDTNTAGGNFTRADLTGMKTDAYSMENPNITWSDTICPNGTKNIGSSPCKGDQLIAVEVPATLNVIDLSSRDLSNARLNGMNLSNFNLSNTNLTKADLSKSNLTQANLSGADLTGANLLNAKLENTRMENVNITSANLSGATTDYQSLSSEGIIWSDTINPDGWRCTGDKLATCNRWIERLQYTT